MTALTQSAAWEGVFTHGALRDLFQGLSGKTAVGLDWISTEKFRETLDDSIEVILRKCATGEYRFTSYKELLITKGPDKLPRCISVPTVRDRLVFSALNRVLQDVYGEEAKAIMPQAIIRQVTEALQGGSFTAFVKTDLSAFYASIDHDILLERLGETIKMEQLLALIECAVKTATEPPNEPARRVPRTKGVPEGLAISNLLANIYMRPIDSKYRHREDCLYWRYVDDILILTTSAEKARALQAELEADLKQLSLATNPDKTVSGDTKESFDFLGYLLSPEKISVRRGSVLKLERSLEGLFRDYRRGVIPNKACLQWKVNLKITGFTIGGRRYGWLFFYAHINDLSLLAHLDWLVGALSRRFGAEDVEFKSFLRAYHEIRKSLSSTKYIPDIDRLTAQEKRELVRRIYPDAGDMGDAEVEQRFWQLVGRKAPTP